VAAAKVLRTFSKQHPQLVIKGGVLEGRMLDASETTSLADLESRDELLSRFAGVMQALIAQPARLAQANLTKFARLLAALQDKKADEPQDAADAGPEPDADTSQPEADTPAADADPTDD
jgi:large subunit ribosomal protein L10